MNHLETYRFWGYAATFGALWGAVEITVGSFLHAVRVPLSGVVLAAFGAALLVSLRSLLPVRGVVLAAGAVCAGVKLLSPAGAIVGPMIAILVEAALVELVLLPVGANPVSGATAGAAASLWALCQKLITQTLFYGLPVIGIYQGILQQAEKLLGVEQSGGMWAAGVLIGMVACVGAAFGLGGGLVGNGACRQLEREGA
ncbi:MAG: hypothetical protein ACOC1F_04785 [Myxococcota bacterium]